MIKEILEKQIEKIKIREKEFGEIEKKAEEFCRKIEIKTKKKKVKADVFIGGSLAKKTILKQQNSPQKFGIFGPRKTKSFSRRDKYDIDIFVRFDKKYKDSEISDLLEKILSGFRTRRIHGSRDYFQLKEKKFIFEIIPVIKISSPKNARNVTDLSYFHVSYVRNKIKKNPKLANEILLAKAFSYAQKCYGAESYIKGFSGYALELLVIYYNGFLNFLKAIARTKEQIIIDPGKCYKNKNNILTSLNESKLQSPIIFIDPTFKERNALAALSKETFLKFQETAKNFLRKPSEKYLKSKKLISNTII